MGDGTAWNLFLIILSICFYFIPSFVGWNKRNGGAIFVLNLLLGWTVIGWIIALIWANTVDPEPSSGKQT